MFNLTNLITAYLSCRKRKRTTINALKFEADCETHLIKLQTRLKNKTYNPGRSICFIVTYPKIREVFAADFADRVIHHLLVNRIESFFEKRFIYDSYACRKNKGIHLAERRIKKALNKITNNQTTPACYLQIDIKSFFAQINKKILLQILEEKIYQMPEFKKDRQKILWLAKTIIFHDPAKNYRLKSRKELFNQLPPDKTLFKTPSHKGLPIGNLTSQFFANVYLNELDQFIKRKLKVKHYFRYADDMVLLSRNKNQLKKWRIEINNFLKHNLDLELNAKKDKLNSVYRGIDFVGYVIKPDYTLARNRVVKNLKTKLHFFNQGLLLTSNNQKQIALPLTQPPAKKEIETMLATVNSYYGHFAHANTYKLRKNIYQKHFKDLKLYLEPVDKNLGYFKLKSSQKENE